MKFSLRRKKTDDEDIDEPSALPPKKPFGFSLKKKPKPEAEKSARQGIALPKLALGKQPPKDKKARQDGGKAKSKVRGKKVAFGHRGARFVLLIGDEGAILIFMQGKKLVRRLFAPSPGKDHTNGIAELMRTHASAPVYMLMDVVDQQFIRQSFPPVSAFSVGGLVKRRLARDFTNEDLKGSMALARDKKGRKEWHYLLVALAHTPNLQQWIDLIAELPNELRGIYLAPVEAQNYIPLLKKVVNTSDTVAEWQLLVTHNKVSGFRQVALHNGKLSFSRVTQAIDDSVPAVVAGNIEQEIINTIEYMRRLGLDENNALELLVVASAEVNEALDLKRFQAGGAAALTPLMIADALQLEQAALSADRFGDVVQAACFAQTKKQVLRFETPYLAKLKTLYVARRAIIGLGALAGLALLGLAASDVFTAFSDRSEAAESESRLAPLRAQVAKAKKDIDALDVDVAKKAAVAAAYDTFLKDTVDPLQFVRDLRTFVTNDKRIVNIEWGPKVTLATTPNAPPPAADPNASTIGIKIEVEFTGDYADVDALEKDAKQYVEGLKTLKGYQVASEPFPWVGQATEKGVEISFKASEKGNLKPEYRKIKLLFVPIPEAAKSPNAGPPPELPGPPPMDMGMVPPVGAP